MNKATSGTSWNKKGNVHSMNSNIENKMESTEYHRRKYLQLILTLAIKPTEAAGKCHKKHSKTASVSEINYQHLYHQKYDTNNAKYDFHKSNSIYNKQ